MTRLCSVRLAAHMYVVTVRASAGRDGEPSLPESDGGSGRV